jgi:hypothetical protein
MSRNQYDHDQEEYEEEEESKYVDQSPSLRSVIMENRRNDSLLQSRMMMMQAAAAANNNGQRSSSREGKEEYKPSSSLSTLEGLRVPTFDNNNNQIVDGDGSESEGSHGGSDHMSDGDESYHSDDEDVGGGYPFNNGVRI